MRTTPVQPEPGAEAKPADFAFHGWRASWIKSAADRRALLVRPASGSPRALVVELHGSGLDIRRHRSMTRLIERLVPHGIAVLLPQAALPFRLKPELAPGYAWNIPGAPLPGASEVNDCDIDDIGWITELVSSTQKELNLPSGPLFLTGYSGGARLASHLLVRKQPDWSAAALVAGLRAVGNAEREPPLTISFHGVEDTINPYAGGLGTRWDLGVEAAGHRYALSRGGLPAFEERAVPGARRRTYRTASGAEALTLYAVLECAHAWPGCSDPRHLDSFGPGGCGVDASRIIADLIIQYVASQEQRGDAENAHPSFAVEMCPPRTSEL